MAIVRELVERCGPHPSLTDIAYALDDARREVRRETAEYCIAEANEYSDPILPSVIEADIRRLFGLSSADGGSLAAPAAREGGDGG